MIDEKKIEEAAQRYSNVTDANKNEASLILEGFKEGVHWFKKSLWHDASEELPDPDKPCLVYGEFTYDDEESYEDYTVSYHAPFGWTEDFFPQGYDYTITRWCYVDDLLPKEGGEG